VTARFARPLNFLHLTTFYPPYSFGGDAMYIYRLAHALGDQGHHVDVVHCVDAYHLLHPADPPISFAEHPNVRRHGLESGYKWLSPLLTQQTGRPFLKRQTIDSLLRATAYDVLHFHNMSLLGPDLLRMHPPLGRPVKLYMTHEHWLICPTHVLWKFNRQPCDRPQCLQCTLRARRPPQIWRYTGLLKRVSRDVDRFVSPSRFTADMHAERGFPEPVGHLPYFIDRVDEDWKDPGPRPQEREYALFVGRLEEIKGLQTLIDVWGRVDRLDLLVAGTGTHEPALKARAAGNARIKFLGALPQRELGRLYAHAVVCIVPSITYETFGIIIIEAFARKTPVIVRDLGALPEVVRESQGGFVYRTDDELIEAIRRLETEPALRCELGECGYRAFLENWSREAHLHRYFNLIAESARERFGEVPWETA
jgi:glycosyltransferase involved in cell wall biosynthesis